MRLLIITFLLMIFVCKLSAFEKQNYNWKIPILPNYVTDIVVSDDESRVIISGSNEYSVYDLKEDTLISRIDFNDEIATNNGQYTALFLTNDELILAENYHYYYYNLKTNIKSIFIDKTGETGYLHQPVLSADKSLFAYMTSLDDISPYIVYIVDANQKKVIDSLNFDLDKLTMKDDNMTDIVFSQDSKTLFVITAAGFLIEYDLENKSILNIFDIASKFGIPLDYRPTSAGNQIYLFTDSTLIIRFRDQTGIINYHTGKVEKMIFKNYSCFLNNLSNNKRYLTLSDFWSGFIIVYDLVNDSIIYSLEGAQVFQAKNGVGILEDSTQIIFVKSGFLTKYDFVNNKTKGYFGVDVALYQENSIKITPDNKYLYCLGTGYYGNCWKIDIKTGKIIEFIEKNILEFNNKCTNFIYFTYPQNEGNKILHIHNMQTNNDEYEVEYKGDNILTKYSDDDKYLVISTYYDNKLIKIIETANYSVVDSFNYDKLSLLSKLCFSKDNRYISFVEDSDTSNPDGLKIIIRDIKNKEFLCGNAISSSFDLFKYEFLKSGSLIGIKDNDLTLSIFEPCEHNSQVYIYPYSASDLILDFIVTKDRHYCLGKAMKSKYPDPSYYHLFIYDIDKKEHIDKLDGDLFNWTVSADNKYLALIDRFPGYLYLYDFESMVTDVNGNNKYLQKTEILISPNPASDYIVINGSIGACPNGNKAYPNFNEASLIASEYIQIFDMLGVNVVNFNPTPTLPEGEGVRIDVSFLAPGVYFIKIGNRVEKFVKM